MRILQIVKYYYPAMTFGGPVRCVYNLAKYLGKRGHEVTVLTTDALAIDNNYRIKDRCQMSENIKILRFPNLTRSFDIFLTPTILGALGKNIQQFDIVHLHEYRTFQNLSFYFTNFLKVPYVMTLHGQLFTTYVGDSISSTLLRNAFDPLLGKRLLRGASKVLALTKSEAIKCGHYGVDPNKILIIPNGIDPTDFINLPKVGEFKSRFGINEENMVLYIGRINKRKGIDILIKSCSKLFANRADTKLVIAGADDGYLNEARRLAESFNLENKILFTGGLTREDILAAYNDATVVVCAGAQEGFPIVLLEAGIMGKPVIVSDDPAVDFVREAQYGLTVKYGNSDQLAQTLGLILDDPKLLKTLGRNGKKAVTENYSWTVIGKRIEDVYYNILS